MKSYTAGIWGGSVPDMPSWKDPLEPKRRQCWWLIDGKMCLKQLHYFMDRDVSYCDDQHETTGKEEKQRKTK